MFALLTLCLLVKLTTSQATSAEGAQCSYTFYVPKTAGAGDQCEGGASNGDIEELKKQVDRLLTLYTEQQKQSTELQKLVTDQQRHISSLQMQLNSNTQQNVRCNGDGDQQNRNQTLQVTTAFTRWGRTECPANSTSIFTGYAAGSYYTHTGGLSEYMCLPSEPQWANYVDGHQASSAIYGVEYETNSLTSILSTQNNHGNPFHDNDVPCTYCEVSGRSIVTMFAARTNCPDGWHLEYKGYVMGPVNGHQLHANPVCIDQSPEVIPGGGRGTDGALLYFVQAACGALPCPPYVEGREIPCVVCSK